MPSRKGSTAGQASQPNLRVSPAKLRIPVVSLILVSVFAPLLFLAGHIANSTSSGLPEVFLYGRRGNRDDIRKLQALKQIENLFPNEVVEVIKSNTDDSGPLSLNIKSRKDLSSSWVVEKQNNVLSGKAYIPQVKTDRGDTTSEGLQMPRRETLHVHGKEESTYLVSEYEAGQHSKTGSTGDGDVDEEALGRATRRQMRMERRQKRVIELTQQSTREKNFSVETFNRRTDFDNSLPKKYSIWRRENEEPDSLVRLMRDQLIMARVYTSLANSQVDSELLRELNVRIKESRRVMGEATVDSELPRSALDKIKAMGQVLAKAREQLYDCKTVTKKLRAMLQGSEDLSHILSKQTAVLRQLVAKTIPKGLHCLSMLLISEYNSLPKDSRDFPGKEKLEDPSLYHYALFSDNVIAAAVVINSTVSNAKEPEKHVFHLVTDKLNYPAMRMWFLSNPPGNSTIEVQNIDNFKWLNSSYCPVLRQLQTASMKEYYFKADHSSASPDVSTNLKYRNPKYLSMLNHLRFYLPEVYPKLDKVLFLDDDIVVQQDLTPLWSIDLNGNVNGAVETCGESFHRFDKYLNFSNPLISENFDQSACGWAYGMNIFDLHQWRSQNLTSVYHKWQTLNEQRELWKLGTLPPGLITFYNLTYALDKRWHVLGLGYDPNVHVEDIESAAVVHYNGNMKPWLELAMSKYKLYWTKYLDQDHHFLQRCNIHM